jgi:hypothetical protein
LRFGFARRARARGRRYASHHFPAGVVRITFVPQCRLPLMSW